MLDKRVLKVMIWNLKNRALQNGRHGLRRNLAQNKKIWTKSGPKTPLRCKCLKCAHKCAPGIRNLDIKHIKKNLT